MQICNGQCRREHNILQYNITPVINKEIPLDKNNVKNVAYG